MILPLLLGAGGLVAWHFIQKAKADADAEEKAATGTPEQKLTASLGKLPAQDRERKLTELATITPEERTLILNAKNKDQAILAVVKAKIEEAARRV